MSSGPLLRVDGLPDDQRKLEYEKLRRGEVITEHVQTLDQSRSISMPSGMVHHWMGTVFIPGVSLKQTLAFLQDYDNQYKFYSPDVQSSRLIKRSDDDFTVFLRLRKTKVITVILNTEYDVKYSVLDATQATSVSRSTRISEVENAGKPGEKEKPVGDDGGFMWRLNSYWRFAERDGGVYIQLEAISLTRDIPTGLGWLVGPFVTSIPKESLIFTLTRTRDGLQKLQSHQ